MIDVNANDRLTGTLTEQVAAYRQALKRKDRLISDLSVTATLNPTLNPILTHTTPGGANVNINLDRENSSHRYTTTRNMQQNLPNHASVNQVPYPTTSFHQNYYDPTPNHFSGNYNHHSQQQQQQQQHPHVHHGQNFGQNNMDFQTLQNELNDTKRLLDGQFRLNGEMQHSNNAGNTHELEILNAKAKMTIDRLQSENNSKQDKLIALQQRVTELITDKEGATTSDITIRSILSDSLVRISGALALATPTLSEDPDEYPTNCREAVDLLVQTSNEYSRELILAKATISQLEADIAKHEEKDGTQDGTVVTLCTDLAESKQQIAELNKQIQEITVEKDSSSIQLEAKDREIEVLRERLDNATAVYDTLKGAQGEDLEARTGMEVDMRKLEYEKRVAETELRTTLECLAQSLSDPENGLEYTENMGIAVVKDRIMQTISAHREKKHAVGLLEKKVVQLTEQLEKQCELHGETLKRAKEAEHNSGFEVTRLRHLETELASQDVLRDTYQANKEKYIHFLNQLSHILGCTELGSSLGLDLSTMDVLLERARQLHHNEGDKLAEKSSNLYILQRKVKELKDSLKNKDMHIDLLRKKLVKLDETNITKETVYIDRDDAVKTARKLEKRVLRLERELGNERDDNLKNKAELSHTRELEVKVLELTQELEGNMAKYDRITSRAKKQNSKLKTLKHDLAMTEADGLDKNGNLVHDLHDAKSDLKTTRISLEEVNRQRKSLENFRSVIAKMLGLEVTSLAVPDFEVIQRLEKLIQTHHVQQATVTQPTMLTHTVPQTVTTQVHTGQQGGQHQMGLNMPAQGAYSTRSQTYMPVRSQRPSTVEHEGIPLYEEEEFGNARSRSAGRRYRSVSPSRKSRHRTRY